MPIIYKPPSKPQRHTCPVPRRRRSTREHNLHPPGTVFVCPECGTTWKVVDREWIIKWRVVSRRELRAIRNRWVGEQMMKESDA